MDPNSHIDLYIYAAHSTVSLSPDFDWLLCELQEIIQETQLEKKTAEPPPPPSALYTAVGPINNPLNNCY